MSLSIFLKKHGFFDHPFGTWIAEDERALSHWYVPPPFLKTVIGYSHHPSSGLRPTSTIVFGKSGNGKTALRLVVEGEVLGSSVNALVVRYIDFTNPLSNGPCPSLDNHVDEILRLATISLVGYWAEHPDGYEALGFEHKCELAGLIYRYYDTLPPTALETYASDLCPLYSRMMQVARMGRKAVVAAYNTTVTVLKKEQLKPSDWSTTNGGLSQGSNPLLRFQRLWRLASAMGIQGIWVLIDGVDESVTEKSSDAVFNCISQLLLSQRVLEFRVEGKQVLCFKFFLTRPKELREKFKSAGFRPDRVEVSELAWSRHELNQALQKRLAYFSNNRIVSFDDICERGQESVQDRLLDQCGLRPRTLFRMGYEILRQVELRGDDGLLKITEDMVRAGIDLGIQCVVD